MKNDFDVMKKVFETGQVNDIQITLVNTPRFLVKVGGNEVWLDAKEGKSNRKDLSGDWVLQRIKESLTTRHLGESFPFIGVDKMTSEKERQNLHLHLRFGVDEYSGTLRVRQLENHIALNEGTNQSAEAIAGLDSNSANCIIFNFVDSEPSDRAGYDRVKKGKLATAWLNTQTGDWIAEKTQACKKMYPPLAHLAPNELSNEDLIKAMGFAPNMEIYHA